MYPLQSHPVAQGASLLPPPHRLGHEPQRSGSIRSNHSRDRPSLNILNDYVPLLPPPPKRNELPPNENVPPPLPQAPAPNWGNAQRPLSDIRELTEPSLVEDGNRRKVPESGLLRDLSQTRRNSLENSFRLRHAHGEGSRGHSSPRRSPRKDSDRSSIYIIPPSNVPPRSSSHHRRERSSSRSRAGPRPSGPPLPPPLLGRQDYIPRKGRPNSPVKAVVDRLDPVTSDITRRVPSRTFYRESEVTDIAEFPIHRHPRINIEIHLGASLYVGGGTIEGTARISIDDAERIRHKRALALARISVDLVGIEEITSAKRSVFLNLATELVDTENPPPAGMVESLKQISAIDTFWHLAPSVSVLPFSLSLPLDVGPPPFISRIARIRYLLSVTLLIRDQEKQYLVRQSQDVTVIPVYDPEKALMSLPSPLMAEDEFVRARDHGLEVIRVTAGLHRQVWVSGTSIFVDIHVVNKSSKTIKRLELQLERDILCYKHAAASTMEKSASQARIFDANDRSILSRCITKAGGGTWSGIAAHTTEIRTCDLELPRGHATVKCGKFFEVRYFLNVVVSSAHAKLVTIQLPIVLIHMNSLDVVPNSVAQVAAAIEEKRSNSNLTEDSPTRSPRLRRRPSVTGQGRAFAAPRFQSLHRMRSETEELQHLGRDLEASPRKMQHSIRRVQSNYNNHTNIDSHSPQSVRKGTFLSSSAPAEGTSFSADVKARLRRMRSIDTASSNTRHGHARKESGPGITTLRTAPSLGLRDLDQENFMVGAGPQGESREHRDLVDGFKQRIEEAKQQRQFQFQFKKKKSGEKRSGLPGVGWLRSLDRDRERDGREGNWI